MNTNEIVNAILASRTASSAALDRVLPELQALKASEVRSLIVDVPTAVSRVLGAAPKVLALRLNLRNPSRPSRARARARRMCRGTC